MLGYMADCECGFRLYYSFFNRIDVRWQNWEHELDSHRVETSILVRNPTVSRSEAVEQVSKIECEALTPAAMGVPEASLRAWAARHCVDPHPRTLAAAL